MLLEDLGAPAPTSAPLTESQDPIRSELFSAERLGEHAAVIAGQRTLPEGETGRPLSPRLRDSERVLHQCYRAIAAVIREEGLDTPAAEWFVDNLHIYRQLPKLADGPLRG